MSSPKVFISYSHDSPAHSERVLQFADALRRHGIDIELDRYHVRPSRGWPHWCEEQLRPENSAFVLVICTETYFQRIHDKVPPDQGRGVFWEGGIIYDYLYDQKGNTRFVPILFADGNADFIPVPIRHHTRYCVVEFELTDPGYQDLYRELTGQPLVTKPPLGEIIKLGSMLAVNASPLEVRAVKTTFPSADIFRIFKYAPAKLIGRESETKLLHEAWSKVQNHVKGRPHILTFVALGGEGKTSLVAKWAAELAAQDWPGCDAVFAWSFYSQGTRDQVAASSDLFLKEALIFFGNDEDKVFAASNAGAFEKGQRLASLVRQSRRLLILDGVEPLQYSLASPTPGEFKDQGLAALLKELAIDSHGLCIVTTRYSLSDLKAFKNETVAEIELKRLSREAGVHLLQAHGVKGSELRNLLLKDSDAKSEKVSEFEKLVEDVDGHALTLHIMGAFLKKAFHGDIRCRDRVTFEKANKEIDKGHAFRAMAAYAKWMEDGSDEARRELAILRLMGLFDRPATSDCVDALIREPAISGLTEPLVGLEEEDWNCSVDSLEFAKLLTVYREASASPYSLDAHPLLREYFASQLRAREPDAWRAAHYRLYKHLCATTPENKKPALEDLQPLYQAIMHGCAAEEFADAFNEVFEQRILQKQSLYSVMRLGAVQSDMGAMAGFFSSFSPPKLNPKVETSAGGFLLKHLGYCLRAAGRLHDAENSLEAASNVYREANDLPETVVVLGLLCSTRTLLGNLPGALKTAEEQLKLLEPGALWWVKFTALSRLAEISSYIRPYSECIPLFDAAFDTFCPQGEDREKSIKSFYSMVKDNEQARSSIIGSLSRWGEFCVASGAIEQAIIWAEFVEKLMREEPEFPSELHKGLMSLFVGQAYLAQLESPLFSDAGDESRRAAMIHQARRRVDDALKWLRSGSRMHELPRALFASAKLRFLEAGYSDFDRAKADLEEAWEIARRGPMKLFLADIHLHRARLFFRVEKYPWISPQADLAAARKLIEECGYRRPKEALAAAERDIGANLVSLSPVTPLKCRTMLKTVLELDLVGYSTIGDNIEQALDVRSVSQLNAQIQGFIDAGLHAVSAARQKAVIKTTGDGAILVFDSAAEAHGFAVAVHQATAQHNATRTQPIAKRVFRIGAATGEIVMEPKPGGGFEIAGTTIARAVRLEAKAHPGGFLIDQATFDALPPEQKGAFGEPQTVPGKRDEVFTARATQPNANGPQDAAFFTAQAPKATPSALRTWLEKLEFLMEQEAIITDPAQKFALKKQIEEAKAKIREHGGEA